MDIKRAITHQRKIRHRQVMPILDMLDMIIRDGGPPAATVARHNGRLLEIAVDEPAANDSSDSLPALDTSSDGADARQRRRLRRGVDWPAMDDRPFPVPAATLRATLVLAVAAKVSPGAQAMLRAARLDVIYKGHDGRDWGTDLWELRVMAPTTANNTIDDIKALEAAIKDVVQDHVPDRHDIETIRVYASDPQDPPSPGKKSIADLRLIDEADFGSDVIEGSFSDEDLDILAISERYNAVTELKEFLRAFPDAVLDLRNGRAKKPNNLVPRPPYVLGDEYDVQDVLWCALRMKYRTAQREDPLRKNAGSSSRMDFTLGNLRFGIEVKFLRPDVRIPNIKTQLLGDLHDVAAGSDITDLVCFLVETKSGIAHPLDQLDGKVDGRTTLHIVRVQI